MGQALGPEVFKCRLSTLEVRVPAVLDRALNRREKTPKVPVPPRSADMKTFTVSIDSRLDQTLDELKQSLGKTSRADVFRLAVTLLKLADEARQEGLKLALAKQGKIEREIVLPG